MDGSGFEVGVALVRGCWVRRGSEERANSWLHWGVGAAAAAAAAAGVGAAEVVAAGVAVTAACACAKAVADDPAKAAAVG